MCHILDPFLLYFYHFGLCRNLFFWLLLTINWFSSHSNSYWFWCFHFLLTLFPFFAAFALPHFQHNIFVCAFFGILLIIIMGCFTLFIIRSFFPGDFFISVFLLLVIYMFPVVVFVVNSFILCVCFRNYVNEWSII